MIYILTEDEGAGFRFFNTLCKQLLLSDKYVVVTSKGNKNLNAKFEEISTFMKSGDRFLVAADTVDSSAGFDWVSFLETVEYFCICNDIELYYTKYYCFEEIFLASNRLFYLSKVSSIASNWYGVVDYIYNSIVQGKNSYSLQNQMVQKVIQKIPKAGVNKEKFYKTVLFQVSKLFDGDYKITDGKLGTCWLENCEETKLPDNGYRCSVCCDCFKDATSYNKIQDICKNSALECMKDLFDFILYAKEKGKGY